MWPFRSHGHDFVRLARLNHPPLDVLDCRCGARKFETRTTSRRETIFERNDPRLRQNALIDAHDFTIPTTLLKERG